MRKRCSNATGRSARTSSEVLIMQAQKLSGLWKIQQHQICITRLYEEVLFELLNAPALQNRISDTVSQALQLHQCKIISNGYKQTRISCFGKLINACYGHTKSIFLCHYCKAYLKKTRRRFQSRWTTTHKTWKVSKATNSLHLHQFNIKLCNTSQVCDTVYLETSLYTFIQLSV